MPRLSDFAKLQAEGKPYNLDSIAGQDVTITDIGWATGKYGEYVLLTVVDENGEIQNVRSTGFLILDAVRNLQAEGALPCPARFVKNGNTWTVE